MVTDSIDLTSKNYQNIHIVGIGGAGMSAIATVLHRMGKKVSGSDLKESHVTDRLKASGISVHVPHNRSLINSDIDVVVRSSAIKDDNIEIIGAKESLIKVASRAEMLSAICRREKSLGVAGSHGKTTTTSMATAIARAANLNPSFIIGGDVNEIGTNAHYQPGSYLIVEADESDKTFLELALVGAIVTNIENDHLENYDDSFDGLKKSFTDFVMNVEGPIVICVDEENARTIAHALYGEKEIITVGSTNADWTYKIVEKTRGGISAIISRKGKDNIEMKLAVPGEHNIKNALCAFALMYSFGVSDQDCIKGLASFGGVARRFQFRGETNGITFVDDYAHLPTEILVTLIASKQGKFRRTIAIFQPHRYSRTQTLYKEFAKALMKADVVIICEVYPAGEDPIPGVSGVLISEELQRNNHQNVIFAKHIEDITQVIFQEGTRGDLVLTLGAGDVTMYSDVIQDYLKIAKKTD